MLAVEAREKTVDTVEDFTAVLKLQNKRVDESLILEISEIPRSQRAVVRMYINDEPRDVSVTVIGETPKRYCVRPVEDAGLSWIGADNTWLVPKSSVQFKEGVCTKSHS